MLYALAPEASGSADAVIEPETPNLWAVLQTCFCVGGLLKEGMD